VTRLHRRTEATNSHNMARDTNHPSFSVPCPNCESPVEHSLTWLKGQEEFEFSNLRLLGLNFMGLTINEMVTNLRPWKRVGGTIMLATGLLLAASEAEKYAPNPFFWSKMVVLGLIGVHAMIFRPIVYKQTEALDRSPIIPTKAKVAAILSVVLWTTMFTMGRLIAYWDAD
jgi:hypothetical protein